MTASPQTQVRSARGWRRWASENDVGINTTQRAIATGEALEFWLDVRLVEAGKPPRFSAGFDETFPDEIVATAEKRIGAVIDSVERRLATLPSWLRVRQLNDDWFIIRPTPKTAAEIWAEASRAGAAP
jgi:hypothetical protein